MNKKDIAKIYEKKFEQIQKQKDELESKEAIGLISIIASIGSGIAYTGFPFIDNPYSHSIRDLINSNLGINENIIIPAGLAFLAASIFYTGWISDKLYKINREFCDAIDNFHHSYEQAD